MLVLSVKKWLGAAALGALGTAAYSFYEPYRYRLVSHVVPVGPRSAPLRVLHLSDTHLNVRDHRLARWLMDLPRHLGEVDLVLMTGDLIENDDGIEPLVRAVENIEARYGRFYVLGSHDYYQSRFQSYVKYFTTRRRGKIRAPEADTERLERRLKETGWKALTNSTEIVETPTGTVRLAGVDDPFLKRHRTEHIARDMAELTAIGLIHAPDVVSEWALHGFDLVVAGHTHGGQVRIPPVGTIVTNCKLPAALGHGLNQVGETWLHVSPGLGTGRFSPIRFACRPEATLLLLTPQVS